MAVAGHIQDRWYRPKRDEDGKIVRDEKGKEVRERSPLYGKGLRYKVHYYDPDGNEKSKSFPDKQLKRAEAFLTKQQHDVLSGTYLDPDAGSETFKEYAQEVLKGRSQDESSVYNFNQRLDNQAHPFLGEKTLAKINTTVIRNWLGWMNESKRVPSDSYQKQVFELVSSILDAAVSDHKMRSNPCKDKSIKRPSGAAGKVRPWAVTKMHAIELALAPRHQIIVPLGSGLGLRQGEIFAFSMDNVDRENMLYRCTRQMVTVSGVRKFKLPKGHKTRDIPLGAGVLEALDAYVENFPPVSITLPWAERDGKKFETINVLMTNEENDLYPRQTFNTAVWRKAFKVANIKYQLDYEDGMHALRHLFASWMLSQGVSIKELAAFLGHASEAFTLKTYVHLMPNSYDRARLAVDAMVKPRKRASTKDAEGGTA
jgi:integrase